MSWFDLDAASIARRANGDRAAVHVPSVWDAISRGIVGFTIVSVAGFAPWALAGRWLHHTLGEAGLYAVCALVFIALSGPLLHRLILGRGSLSRFNKLFGIGFAVYAIAWTVGWMWLGGNKGSLLGLLVGTSAMGWIFASAFDARGAAWKIIPALFLCNAAGYFVGGWMESALSGTGTHSVVDKLVWGVCYGVGFGAGLGLAFHYCQSEARRILHAQRIAPTA